MTACIIIMKRVREEKSIPVSNRPFVDFFFNLFLAALGLC